MDFAFPVDHTVKELKESEKDKWLNLAKEMKKTVEHESEDYTNCNRYTWYSHRSIGKRTGGHWNIWTSGDHPNYCIIEIGQNTE